MRALILPAAALALAGAVVLVGGRMVESPVAVDEPDPEEMAAAGGSGRIGDPLSRSLPDAPLSPAPPDNQGAAETAPESSRRNRRAETTHRPGD